MKLERELNESVLMSIELDQQQIQSKITWFVMRSRFCTIYSGCWALQSGPSQRGLTAKKGDDQFATLVPPAVRKTPPSGVLMALQNGGLNGLGSQATRAFFPRTTFISDFSF